MVLRDPVRGDSGDSLFACSPSVSPARKPLFSWPVPLLPLSLLLRFLAAQIANTNTGHDRLTVAIQRSPRICHRLVPTSWRDFSHTRFSIPTPSLPFPFNQNFPKLTFSSSIHISPSSSSFLLFFSYHFPSSLLFHPPPLFFFSSFLFYILLRSTCLLFAIPLIPFSPPGS